MDITSKYKIVESIIQSDNDLVLTEIESLLGLNNQDFWVDLPEQLKSKINQAKSEVDSGKGISHSIVMEEINKLFLNK
ncbi:hypothetical protein [Pedobacter jejuensis]|uniref:Uncharacterized protein n=1 Tax=Pedobacter jejuensis TaxID=1268550 RepID=A0A3N0BQ18_9SPHI|nr:hypothetical protein [Pedobacter jejuensis]RNL51056.1 hypothetical protein D7004_15125 [Pedobacter jejuensis]